MKRTDSPCQNRSEKFNDAFTNGEVINSGYGSAVLGDPANAVAWLAKQMWNYGVKLNKGDIVLSGAFTAAISASRDSFTCDW